MKSQRIAIIGGGSTTFVPPVIDLLIDSNSLKNSTVILMDLNRERLDLMRAVCEKRISQKNCELKIESTTDRRKALTNADFVLVSIASGGFDIYEFDLEIPARYGIFTMGGETVGPGGLLHAFRHIPILVDICREIEEVAPEAWLLNYTNPDTCILMALERLSAVKKISLCTCSAIPRHAEILAREVNLPPEDLVMPAISGGLNHCAAVLELRLKDGRDALPAALPKITKPILKFFLERYGLLPYGAGHWTEFFPEHTRLAEPYEGQVQGLTLKYGRQVRDMHAHRSRVASWEKSAADYRDGSASGEEVFHSRLTAGEWIEVVDLMEALIENKNELHAVVTRNRGAISNLPYDSVVEVTSVVGGNGIHPLQVGPLPEPIAANLRLHIDVFELVVEAALTGDRKIALDALLLDPQTSAKLTPSKTEQMLDEMLAAEAAFLPQFFDGWRP